jgi:hypothetical protein
VWPLALTLATLLVTLAAMSALWSRSRWAGPMDIAAAAPPASGATYYLAHDRGGHVDHHVLYHGLDPLARERLAAASLLFLGNSRLMFALDRQVLRRVLTPRGVRYYVLGFGHDEASRFPLAIIERLDLRPAVVVANVDGFFTIDQSPWAEKVRSDDWFAAFKLRLEATASHTVRQRLHTAVPHWPDLMDGQREFVIYRSALDGTWTVATPFRHAGPLPVKRERGGPPVDPASLERARAFKAALDARGTRLVLCLVPSPDTSRAEAAAMADALGVPLVAPVADNPRTMDGSHLTEASAEAFATQLLDALVPLLPAQSGGTGEP